MKCKIKPGVTVLIRIVNFILLYDDPEHVLEDAVLLHGEPHRVRGEALASDVNARLAVSEIFSENMAI